LRSSGEYDGFPNKIVGRAGRATGTGLAELVCPMRPTPGQVRLDDLLRVCRSGQQINHALMKEMLGLFIQENRRRISAALGAAETGNSVELRGAVHALKGSAALIGAEHLRDLAANLEFRVVSGTVQDVDVATRQLQDEYAAVVSTLQSIYPDLATD
jgi:HPt (histidine-containing phosphotransfer) domain-containing protein